MLRCVASSSDNNIYNIDSNNPFEGDQIFAIISTFMEELMESYHVMFIENVNDPFDRYKRFKKYLSDGFDIFIYLIEMYAYEDYDSNSLDGLFAIIIIGLHLGINDDRYQQIKLAIFAEEFYHCLKDIYQSLDLFIDKCVKQRQYIPPIRQINGAFYDEANDINCYQIKDSCTISLIGNWATGTMSSIETIKAIKQFKPDYLIHLGNVYQSGSVHEHLHHLIRPIKQYLPKTKTFIVPGDHSYYSGTDGIEYSLKMFGQNLSYFSLFNKHIQFQGIDNVFANQVNKEELDWHIQRTSQAKVKGRRIVYLTHSSPVSLWNQLGYVNGMSACINPTLFSQFENTIDDVDAWFFSQEKSFNLMGPYIYNDHVIVRPRLIGNSSSVYKTENLSDMPGDFDVSMEIVPLPQPLGVYPSRYLTMLNTCFVIIKINSKRIKINYYELCQIEMGVYDKPKLLLQEIIDV